MGSVPDKYTTGDLLDRILAALTEAGHEIDPLAAEALAPVEDFRGDGRRPAPDASPVNLALLIPDFPTKAGNLVQNFREGRTRLVRAVATAV